MPPNIPYPYIAIEGNIGSGKTTLARKLASSLDANLLLEEFDQNPFLRPFYRGEPGSALDLEWSLLSNRQQMIQTYIDNPEHQGNKTLISDFHLQKSEVFAKITLPDSEFIRFQQRLVQTSTNLPEPDLLIFMEASIPSLMANIADRNRPYERGIEAAYLQRIQEGYQEFITGRTGPTLIFKLDYDSGVARAHPFKLIETIQEILDRQEHPEFYYLKERDQDRWI